VLGHETQKLAFRRAIQRGRLAHAYLFCGLKGVGKHTFALELAKALLCESRLGSLKDLPEACDRCAACVQIDAGTHPDFFAAARPAELQEFPIELMREVCQGFALKPARGRGKVVVLDDADDLNEEASNCFLKTLEEPPPRAVLILVGTSPDRQLATIVSRCQVILFSPLAPALVDDILRKRGIEDPAFRAQLVRIGAGSPGRALELADPELWAFRTTLLTALAHSGGPSPKIAKDWLAFVEAAGKEAPAQRRRARAVLALIVDYLLDALNVSVGAPPQRTGAEDMPHLLSFASQVSPDTLVTLLARCLATDRHIERNVQVVLSLEAFVDAVAQQAVI
jgi:DNA polymerase-3 subunit delta'